MKPSGQRAREAIQFEFLPQLVVVQRKGREWIEARKQSQSQGFRIREEPAPQLVAVSVTDVTAFFD